MIASNECMVCWTVGHKLVIQTRNHATELRHDFLAEARRFGWSFLGAFAGRAHPADSSCRPKLTNAVEDLGAGHRARVLSAVEHDRRLHALRPRQDDQLLQDAEVGPVCLHVLGVSAQGLGQEPERLRRLRRRLFRGRTASAATCRSAPISSRQDTSSLLSYTYDGDIISLDPIHSPGERDKAAWDQIPA